MKSVVIIDYDSGNLYSVERAVRHVCPHRVIVSRDADVIEQADAIVFPGQGAAKQCMLALQKYELDNLIQKAINEKPFLGICMGLQVLMEFSEEDGGVEGLGIIEGRVKRFESKDLKIPQIGWNRLHAQWDHPLLHGLKAAFFYFVHSYYVQPSRADEVVALSEYGESFCSAVAKNQLFAIQAHPEKSGEAGLRLLTNFCQSV